MVKVIYSFKSQQIERIEIFAQGTDEYQYESVIIADPKCIEISRFCIKHKLVTKRSGYCLSSNE